MTLSRGGDSASGSNDWSIRGQRYAAAAVFALPFITGAAMAADVDVTASTDQGPHLDHETGTTVRVLPGVVVENDLKTLMPGPAAGSYNGIFASTQAWTLTNDGTVFGEWGDAVSFEAGGTVINNSSITSEFNGVVITGGTAAVTNADGATLHGWSNAVFIDEGGTVDNFGTMTSEVGNVVILNGGGTLTNQEGGIIETTSDQAPAVSLGAGGANVLLNSGLIQGVTTGGFATGAAIMGGETTNFATGIIRGDYNAIWAITGSDATITNHGLLESLEAGAIEMQQGGTVTNYGTIEGFFGIEVLPGFMVTDASTDVINAGTIIGNGGPAIRFRVGTNSLTLLPTSSITGAIIGGPGTDSFILDGAEATTGTFNVDSNAVTNFEGGQKTGAGTWSLTGTAAFVPTFDVQAGRLNVDGTLASLDVTVQSGAVLGGIGVIESFNALSGSTIAPGNSIGTTTTATADFDAGSTLEVELDPTTSDLLDVTGTATIDAGAAVLVIPGAGIYTVGTEYLILDAGDRVGAFGTLTDTSAFLTFVLDQDKDPDQVWLRVASIADFTAIAETFNQMAAATALQDLGPADPLFQAVAPLGGDDALTAFDQLSGEIYASAVRALIEDSRHPREAALDRVGAAFAVIEEMNATQALGLWARAIGSIGVIPGDGNAADLDYRTAGLIVGADGLIGDDFVLGVEAGVTRHGFAAADRNSAGTATGYHLGLYGGLMADATRVKLAASYSGYGVSVERAPTFTGFGESASSDYLARTAQVFAELSHAITLDQGTLEPFIRVAAIHHDGGDYAETGGSSALSGNVDASLSGLATLGLYGSTLLVLGDGMEVELKGMLGWEHHFGDVPTATHSFASGAPFTVAAAGFGSGAVGSLGVAVAVSDSVSLDMDLRAGGGTGNGSVPTTATLAGSF